MPYYLCRLGTREGTILEKGFEAKSREDLKDNLTSQGYYIFSIKRPLNSSLHLLTAFTSKIKTRDFLALNQELYILLRAGLPVVKCLDILLEKREKGALKEVLQDIRREVEEGQSLSDAFAKYSHHFPVTYGATLKAGERSGTLISNLLRFINYQKRMDEIKKKTIQGLYYPAILAIVTVFALFFLLLYVIPSFARIYLESRTPLPYPTQILLGLASFLKGYFLLIILGLATIILGSWFWKGSAQGRRFIDHLKLRLPFLGDLYFAYFLVNSSMTLSTILKGGIPLVSALQILKGSIGNQILDERLEKSISEIQEGQSLSESFGKMGLYSPVAVRMLGVGETTGSLEDMLEEISSFYELELDRKLHVIMTSFEPALMIIMGLIVGGLVIALYLPIFRLAGTIY